MPHELGLPSLLSVHPALTLQGSPGHPPQIPAISTSNEIPASVSESTLCLAAISSYDLQNLLYLCKCAIKHHESSSGYSDIAKMLVPKHNAHNDAEVLYDNLDPVSLMFDQLVPLDTSFRGTSTYSPRSGELPIELPRLSYMSPAGPYWREPHETDEHRVSIPSQGTLAGNMPVSWGVLPSATVVGGRS